MKQRKIIKITKRWAWWWLPLLVGTILRLANLPQQMLGDDELHVVRVMLSQPAAWILTHYSDTDYGIPLALFFKLLMRMQLPITEMTLRLPILITGLLLLAGLPLVVRRVAGTKIAVWFIWLLAFAPSLVFYSRIVRTYMPVTLLAYGAVWSFYFWYQNGQRRWAAGYVILAALAVYWHLVAVPFVLTPLLFAAWQKWRTPEKNAFTGKNLVSLGLLAGGAILFLQLPALPSLIALSLNKSGSGYLSLSTIWQNLFLQAGARFALVMALFWGLVIAGWVNLYRLRPEAANFILWLFVGHLVGLLILRPLAMQVAHVFNRYVILMLPLFLLAAASALSQLPQWAQRLGWREGVGGGAAALLLLLLFLSGPFTRPVFWQNQLTHHNDFVRFNCALPTFAPEHVPLFYQDLAAEPAHTVTLLEYPWDWTWHYGHINLAYALWHGQTVLGAPPNIPYLADDRLALNYLIPPTPEDFLASSAHYLIIHKDWLAEEMRLAENPCLSLPVRATDGRGRDPRWQPWRDNAAALASRLEQSWGEPFYEDDTLWVWDLNEVR